MPRNIPVVWSATSKLPRTYKKQVVWGVLLGAFVSGGLVAATVPTSLQALGPVLIGTSTPKATVLFVGDVMLDRSIRSAITKKGSAYVFGGVAPLLQSADLTVGNLEGPVTNNPSTSYGSAIGGPDNYTFTFPTTSPALLTSYGFDVVSIGNNHIFDFGHIGVEDTIQYLHRAGLSFVGNPLSTSPSIVFKSVNGITIAFLAYNDFVGQDVSALKDAIARARLHANVVVVLAHWGVEYVSKAPARIQTLAHTLAKAGADIIIGTHPHVIQPFEDIQTGTHTTRVYYSLGNFIFDQWFSPEVTCGLTVQATITKTSGVHIDYMSTKVGLRSGGATVVGCN